jgi:heme exporter protein A
MRTLVGLSHADRGQIDWNGKPVREEPEAFRRDTLYLGHHAAVKEELSPIENLQLACALDGTPVTEDRTRAALQTLGLAGRGRLPVRYLSAGQKRRVLLSRLLLRPAKLWVLDEPFAALDTGAVELLGTLIGEHLSRGGMALLTSHQPVPLAGGGVVTL